jgi:hypothetical protein
MKLKITHIITLFAVLFLLASCKKEAERLILKEEKKLEGTWNIDEYTTRVTDSLGVTVSEVTENNTGDVKFTIASEVDADVFNLVQFNNITGGNALVGYFQGYNAGDPTVNNGWAVYWDVDPNGQRILFWGITGGGSYHKTVNLEYDGKNKMTWTYLQLNNNSPNVRTFYTYVLSK